MAWTRCHSALIRPHKSSNGRFELRNRNRGGAHGGRIPATPIMDANSNHVNEDKERAGSKPVPSLPALRNRSRAWNMPKAVPIPRAVRIVRMMWMRRGRRSWTMTEVQVRANCTRRGHGCQCAICTQNIVVLGRTRGTDGRNTGQPQPAGQCYVTVPRFVYGVDETTR